MLPARLRKIGAETHLQTALARQRTGLNIAQTEVSPLESDEVMPALCQGACITFCIFVFFLVFMEIYPDPMERIGLCETWEQLIQEQSFLTSNSSFAGQVP